MSDNITDLLTEFLTQAHTLPGVESLTVCVERPDQKLTIAAIGMADAALPLHMMHTAFALLSNVDPTKVADSEALRDALSALRRACETDISQALARAGCPGASQPRH